MLKFAPKTCKKCGKTFQAKSRSHAWCGKPDCRAAWAEHRKQKEQARIKAHVGNPRWKKIQRDWYAKNKDKARVYRASSDEKHPSRRIFYNAMSRAKSLGLAFNISESDIAIPAVCPVLGIPLVRGKGRQEDGSPSIDRIYPPAGYVRGNIVVVSSLANRIKNSATVQQIQTVADFYRKLVTQ